MTKFWPGQTVRYVAPEGVFSPESAQSRIPHGALVQYLRPWWNDYGVIRFGDHYSRPIVIQNCYLEGMNARV